MALGIASSTASAAVARDDFRAVRAHGREGDRSDPALRTLLQLPSDPLPVSTPTVPMPTRSASKARGGRSVILDRSDNTRPATIDGRKLTETATDILWQTLGLRTRDRRDA